MLSRLYEYLLNRSAIMRTLATVLWHGGCFGLLAGAMVATANAMLGVVTSMGGGAEATYQQLFPSLPTWWIPESPIGVAFYVSSMLAAYTLNELARALDQFQSC